MQTAITRAEDQTARPTNLFVDSNVFLSFYHFSSDDLDELKKLSKHLINGEIVLFLPEQVISEVRRNRDGKILDAYRAFRDSKIDLRLPQICKQYDQYQTIKSSLTVLKKAKSELDALLLNDIKDWSLKADATIGELFKLAKKIPSDQYLPVAQKRYQLGNPPGKNESFGDAVNWEALVCAVPDGEDLFFVSDDKDFRSPFTGGGFNSFLKSEWDARKHSKLFHFARLSEFFQHHFADIQLRWEEEKDRLITNLANSRSFAETHLIIGKLRKFDGFSEDQIRQLVEAGVNNSQVYQISLDEDVEQFYEKLLEGKEELIDSATWKEFGFLFSRPSTDTPESEADLSS